MTTYLRLYDAAGESLQWPQYPLADVEVVAATRSKTVVTATISSGVFAGEHLRQAYHGRFNLSGDTLAGRITGVDIRIGGEAVLSERYDEPVRVRAYDRDFNERMKGDVSFLGNALSNWLETGAGNDTLAGGGGDDSLRSSAGDDRVFGGYGRDTLDGGAGSDTLVGGAGDDNYWTDGGDSLWEAADGGHDTIGSTVDYRLPDNFERLVLLSDAVSGWGNGTRNWLAGNEQANALYGFAGGDALAGFVGADTLVGGFGNDWMLGGFGRDRLSGGAGNDVLYGGGQGDWLTGGPGADTFALRRPSDSAPRSRDVISDFGAGDRIDLQDMDARADHAGDDAFRYIGAQWFHEVAGELRYARGLLSGDVDGDGSADFVVRVLDAPALDVTDFLL